MTKKDTIIIKVENVQTSNGTDRGVLLVQILVFGAIAALLISSIIAWAGNSIRDSRYVIDREKTFYIAEAGVEYYRWHLAHAQSDFQDGTATSGPYIHNYVDSSSTTVGTFTLAITPPPLGSTIVTIVSTGQVASSTVLSRSIEVKLAIPSLSKYSFVANTLMRFGQGTEVFGPIQSNGGIRFDGLAHNIISSAVASYDDPDHNGGVEFGVHTHVTAPSGPVDDNYRPLEAFPSVVQTRVDVFEAGRQFPVPAIDFNGFTSNLASMKTIAQSGGRYFGPSGGGIGYYVLLKTNDTFDLYNVTSLNNPPGGCNNHGQTGWGTWSIKNKTLIGNYTFPVNGTLFIEDNVWVDGQINTARLTIASGKFPEQSSTNTSITVNNNLLYTNYDGRDVLALVVQGNMNVGLSSADDLRIDASILAKNGRAGRYYYENQCGSNYIRSSFTNYGMIGSNQRYGYAYTDGTGYTTRNLIYDANLLYGPPPNFPLASNQYTVISWREL